MKKIWSLLLFMFLPIGLWAGDACTNPGEYMADKRCYVTAEQKKIKPYNAVVFIPRDGASQGGNCSGTMVNDKNKKPYLYTAKHCTDVNGDGEPDASLDVTLQNGTKLTVTKNNVGNLDIRSGNNMGGDWAVYAVNSPYVSSIDKSKYSGKSGEYSARVIGYGRLRIMSNAEIKDFKQRYMTYLKNKGVDVSKIKKSEYGMDSKSIYTENVHVQQFINQLDSGYYAKIFKDTRMKESKCRYSLGTGGMRFCHGWHGDSGAGIFDNDGNIMGIVSYGTNIIDGLHHAELTGSVGL